MFHPIHPRYQTLKHSAMPNEEFEFRSDIRAFTLDDVYSRIDEDLAQL